MKFFGLIAFSLLLLVSGCASSAQKGLLEGKITIGPICPVETIPPNPNCEPTEETFKAYTLTVYKVGNGDPGPLIKVTEFYGDKDGNYRVELPAGRYEIRRGENINFGYYSSTVEIKAGQATKLDIDIDTGIR